MTYRSESITKTRSDLRRYMRNQRRALDIDERLECANHFATHFCRTKLFIQSRKIACYLTNDGEMDLSPVIQMAWKMKKKVYLPVLHAPFDQRLLFARYKPNSTLSYNRFKIAEPTVAARCRAKPQNMDLVLVPLVAFDKTGNRIGMGGGFYDRSFKFLLWRNKWQHPKLIGCAYNFQQVETIDNQTWDVPLAGIATETGLLTNLLGTPTDSLA